MSNIAGYILVEGSVFDLMEINESELVIPYDMTALPKSDYQLVPEEQKKVALGWLAGQKGEERLKEMYGSGLPIYEPIK